jgi:ribosome modulation factor
VSSGEFLGFLAIGVVIFFWYKVNKAGGLFGFLGGLVGSSRKKCPYAHCSSDIMRSAGADMGGYTERAMFYNVCGGKVEDRYLECPVYQRKTNS